MNPSLDEIHHFHDFELLWVLRTVGIRTTTFITQEVENVNKGG